MWILAVACEPDIMSIDPDFVLAFDHLAAAQGWATDFIQKLHAADPFVGQMITYSIAMVSDHIEVENKVKEYLDDDLAEA